MIGSSAVRVNNHIENIDENDGNRVIILVHNIRPPFLNSDIIFTK